jgi:dTDP-glucose 4,6-dehydratase
MNIMLVTGGAGFIGSNFTRYFLRRNKNFLLINIDKLTYAGNPANLRDLENSPRYHFIKGDICNQELVSYVFRKYRPDFVVNFAAESHVDRSIHNPYVFAETNLMGTLNLLECARSLWSRRSMRGCRFIQISTDEVYGSIGNNSDYFLEETTLAPNSPYSASKASADMMTRAYCKTYGLPVIVTRCCNNYGPWQNTEKFIPTCITSALRDKPIPIYGSGTNVREWLHVLDHCTAIIRVLFYGINGEIYNIGSGEEITNLELAKRILNILGKPEDMIKLVADRPGHDKRYALNSYKVRNATGWTRKYSLADGLKDTVAWYQENRSWWDSRE